MEDTRSLLIMVLHKIFHDRPKIVEDTYQMIYNYNNSKKEQSAYEKTLKSICNLMNDELPSQILVYLLTLVDMPLEGEDQLPIMEKIKKNYSCIAGSARPYLLEYLLKKKPDEKSNKTESKNNTITIKREPVKSTGTSQQITENKKMSTSNNNEPKPEIGKSDTSEDNKFVKPTVKRTRRKRIIKNNPSVSDECENVKTLLDISANYVIRNEANLKSIYKSKLAQAWKMIKSDVVQGESLQQCYNAVKDLNKKTKLLRCIENNNITEDILMEEYGESEIFLKKELPLRDPFVFSDKLLAVLKNFI